MANNQKSTGRPLDERRLESAEANDLKDKIDKKRGQDGPYASLLAFYQHAFDQIYITSPDENEQQGKPYNEFADFKLPKSPESLKRAYENIFSGKRPLSELYLKLLEKCLDENRSQLLPKHFPSTDGVPITPPAQLPPGEPPATNTLASGSPSKNPGSNKNIPHNLPDPPEHYFGHKKLRNGISHRLARNGLVVLHEVGGMGKTTFANQVAHDAMRSNLSPGGIVWIDCEVNPTFEDCLRTMAGVLSENSMASVPIDECRNHLDNYLKKQHTILIFDNYETVCHNDEFNQFLFEHRNAASLLVTTREIHDGMKSYVHRLPQFSRAEAEQMFIHYAGLTSVTASEKSKIGDLCERVEYLPLAILLLARLAPRATLADLADELDENINLLKSNDVFLKPRHRSMQACFGLSFNRLPAQDHDTLRLLSLPPFGIGKNFIKEYLANPDWSESVNNCLNSSLLNLQNERYFLHPMVKTLLDEKMGDNKSEWSVHFVDFFCGQLNEVANQSHGKAHLALRENEGLREEADNIWSALRSSFHLNSQEYRILFIELIEDAQELYFGERQKEEDIGEIEEWLEETALPDARNAGDNRLEERILIILLRLGSMLGNLNCNEAMLSRLSEINPDRASGITFDSMAFADCKRGDLKSAESNLRQSIAAWEALGRNFRDELQADLLNYFNVLTASHKGAEATAVARRLWEAWSEEVLLGPLPEGGPHYYIRTQDFGWAFAAPGWGAAFYGEHNEYFARYVGERLDNLEQWDEAKRWLKKAMSIQLKCINDPILGPFYTKDGIDSLRGRLAKLYSATKRRGKIRRRNASPVN